MAQDSRLMSGDLVIFIIISCNYDFMVFQYHYVLVYSVLTLF